MSALDLIDIRGPLYQKRKAVFPKAVNGFYRRLKWVIMAVTLTIYYVTPWLRWDRGAYAPDQAVLIDLANRRFYMFSIEIWPQEFYYVAGLLIMAGIGLFLVTSAVGRAWCGYACPQTVWTDLFVHIERAIDGDRNAQIKLAAAPWSAGKARQAGAQIRHLAGDRGGDRRRLDLLFRRCADAGARIRHRHARLCRLCDGRRADLHHLPAWRLHARAGVHLHVPLAAHPDGDAR